MLKPQEMSFRRLLNYVWEHSRFYRDYYGSHGIREKDLAEVAVQDLPFLTKKTLMENFDRAVTDPELKKNELEQWIQEVPNPGRRYRDHYIVLHTSGSSGDIAIFVYDLPAWRVMNATVTKYFPPPESVLDGKTRVACYLAVHGHFGGVTSAAMLPRTVYDVLVASLLDSTEQVVRELNAFQPHRISGYPSSVAILADSALRGDLRIQPQTLIMGGEVLTQSTKAKIQSAWQIPMYEMYSASESIYIAVRPSHALDMRVVEDLNVLEILDQNHQAVRPDQSGRVVITNLYNYVLPILRYELGDYAIRGQGILNEPITAIRDVQGRANDALPVMLDNGNGDTIHPIILSEFYVAGLQNVQFISRHPALVTIHYVAPRNIDESVRREFHRILEMKQALRTRFEVQQVEQIDLDSKTGKLPLVKVVRTPEAISTNIADVQLDEIPVGVPVAKDATKTTADKQRVLGVNNDQRRALMAKNVPSSGNFVEFRMEEIDQSIPARFEQVVREYPDRIAVKTKSQELTYDALNKTANRVARAILQHRSEAEEPVALLLEKGASMMPAILGVLKAGKIYVPFDPAHPRPRINSMLEDSQAELIVTNNRNLALAGEIARSERPLLNLDNLPSNLSGENLGLSISPDNLAYILYTSGSTGEPKGVVQNHRNVMYKTRTYTNNFRFCADDRISLLSPCTFSLSVGFIFGALLNGACLYPMDIREEGLSRLKDWLIDESVTVYNSVPTAFRSFVGTLNMDEKFPKLRLIHMGGALNRRDVELYKEHFAPDCIMVHDLGSNESGTIAQYFIDKTTPIDGSAVPSGYAVDDAEILILDELGKEAGFDRVGEVALKSRYVALGYWRRPDLTQAAFLSDPAEEPKRIYRTGDLGSLRPDGRLQYLGRKDFQVKIRGHRIEVAEIELALVELAAIEEAVVVAQQDEPNETYLIAYVVSRQDPAPLPSALRRLLKEKLPEPMVPSTFVFMDRLPLTPNGKVDRQALPQPDHTRIEREETLVAPRNPMEQHIADIWAKVLNLAQVGIHDDFFDLGGHSLSAAQVMSRVREAFHVELPLRLLLEGLTIADMAAFITREQAEMSGEPDAARILTLPDREQGDL